MSENLHIIAKKNEIGFSLRFMAQFARIFNTHLRAKTCNAFVKFEVDIFLFATRKLSTTHTIQMRNI